MNKPTTGEIRLALDLVEFFYPLYKTADKQSKAILVKEIFAFDIQTNEIERVASFKQVLFSRVVSGVKTQANGRTQITTMRVRRKKL